MKVTSDTRFCPKCSADWQASEIPAEHRHYFGDKNHFSRLVLISSLELDRGIAWRCPDCGQEFPR